MPSRAPIKQARPTAGQIRAAIALLGWTQSDAADHSGLALQTISRASQGDGPSPGSDESCAALRAAFWKAGVALTDPDLESPPNVYGQGVHGRGVCWRRGREPKAR
jgi:hypothetical protein